MVDSPDERVSLRTSSQMTMPCVVDVDRVASYICECLQGCMKSYPGTGIPMNSAEWGIRRTFVQNCLENLLSEGQRKNFVYPEPVFETVPQPTLSKGTDGVSISTPSGELDEVSGGPRVMRRLPFEEALIPVPVEYDSDGKGKGATLKCASELDEMDKSWVRGKCLTALSKHMERYERIVEALVQLSLRLRELSRKLGNRRARRCFDSEMVIGGAGNAVMNLIPKGDKKYARDHKMVQEWYWDFRAVHEKREAAFRSILPAIAMVQWVQEGADWMSSVGEVYQKSDELLEHFLLKRDLRGEMEELMKGVVVEQQDGSSRAELIQELILLHVLKIPPDVLVQIKLGNPKPSAFLEPTSEKKDCTDFPQAEQE